MEIRIKTELNKKETEDVLFLLETGKKKDSSALSFPFGDRRAKYFLCYESGKLLSVLVLCQIDDDVYECIAWTSPEYRSMGYFHLLWKEASRMVRNGLFPSEKVRIHFIWDHRCPEAEHVIRSLHALPLTEEYQLSAVLPSPEISGQNTFSGCEGKEFQCRLLREESDGTRKYAVGFSNGQDSGPILEFSVIPGSRNKNCYLFDLTVRKELRGQKYGSRIFPLILSFLYEEGFRYLSLQVSSSNIPAVRLYKNAGLKTDVTLSYYEMIL